MAKHYYKLAWMIFCAGILTGCANKTTRSPYATLNHRPGPDLIQYFTGTVNGSGVKYNANGKVVSRYHVSVTGQMQGGDLFVRENLKFTDGRVASREMCLHLDDEKHITGAASDVDSIIKGERIGNAMRFAYQAKTNTKDNRLPQTYDQIIPEFGNFCRSMQAKWNNESRRANGEMIMFDDWFYRINRRISNATSTMFREGNIVGRWVVTFKK